MIGLGPRFWSGDGVWEKRFGDDKVPGRVAEFLQLAAL
jgi:hypothetical protein